jgi:PAP2 superfamily C-terminal
MKALKNTYIKHFLDKNFIQSFLLSVFLLACTCAINVFAIRYAGRNASNSVTDVFLSNVPVFNVDEIFIWGTLVVVVFSVLVMLLKPNKIPFAIKTLSLFILVRSFFNILTHIGPFPVETERTSYDFLNGILFGADSFFSGHTGMPFLGALVFWDNKIVRYIYLFSSVFFGIVVLLGHLHYSIDVLSAFFITYTIYHISEFAFKHDKKVFDSAL